MEGEDRRDDFIDYREVTKFDPEGVPYKMTLYSVAGIETLTKYLQDREDTDEGDPLIAVGDLSGMGDFNNEFGREVADLAIEKALLLFARTMSKLGLCVSPSGDEMWLLPDAGVDFKRINQGIAEFLGKLNALQVPVDDEGTTVGLNAKFYVGRTKFSDVEALLKFDPETGEKLEPGIIKIQGALIDKDEDLVVRPTGVSDQKRIEQGVEKGKTPASVETDMEPKIVDEPAGIDDTDDLLTGLDVVGKE